MPCGNLMILMRERERERERETERDRERERGGGGMALNLPTTHNKKGGGYIKFEGLETGEKLGVEKHWSFNSCIMNVEEGMHVGIMSQQFENSKKDKKKKSPHGWWSYFLGA